MVLPIAALPSLSGCAAPLPPPVVVGTLPTGPGAGFTVTSTGPDISRRTVAGVVQCLTQAGMAMGATPTYFVQLSHTVRLAQTLVLLPPDVAAPASGAAPTPGKPAKPVKLKKGSYERLAVTVTDLAGHQVFGASAMQLLPDKPSLSKPAAAAALTELWCKAVSRPAGSPPITPPATGATPELRRPRR